MKLVIDRRVWLRGEGVSESRLLRRSDAKMCCAGFYLTALGLPRESLVDRAVMPRGGPPEESAWLINHQPTPDGEDCAFGVNDDASIDEPQREKRIAALFAKHGVEVEFTDGGE